MLFTAMPMAHNQMVQPVRGTVERRTLREELEARGVRVIASKKVRAYQRQMVKKERAGAGIGGKSWIFPYWFENSLLPFAISYLPYGTFLMLMLFAGWSVPLAVWSGAVVMVAMQTSFLYLFSVRWRRVPVGMPDEYIPGGYSEIFLPAHAKEICFHVRQIGGVRVFVEELGADPFMIARRSNGFWRMGEECVIAYWDAPGFDPD